MKNEYPDLENTIQQYVLGKLSESQAEEFEAYYISNPDIIEMVEITQNIQIGLENSKQSTSRVSQTDSGTDESLMQRLMGWISVPMPAYATLALAVLLSPLIFIGINQSENTAELTLLNFSTEQTRGAAPTAIIDLSNVTGPAGILVKLKRLSHPQYKLKMLVDDAPTAIWSSKPFTVGALRDRLVLVPTKVPRSKLTIEVIGLNSDGTEQAVEFCHYSEVCR